MSITVRLFIVCYSTYALGIIQGAADFGVLVGGGIAFAVFFPLCWFSRRVVSWISATAEAKHE